MAQIPNQKEKITERIAEINEEIDRLEGHGLSSISAISEENRGGDDPNTEAEMDQNALGQIRQQIEDLRQERSDLEQQLQNLG